MSEFGELKTIIARILVDYEERTSDIIDCTLEDYEGNFSEFDGEKFSRAINNRQEENIVSYQKGCPIDTPKAERRKQNIGDVFENKAKCLVCRDIIMSENRHHMKTCKCGNLSVDGGSWYLKRGYEDASTIEELSTWYKDAE